MVDPHLVEMVEQRSVRMRLRRNLTVQVLVAISLGILLGAIAPSAGKAMKPVGDTFINLVKMVIAPIIVVLAITAGPPQPGSPR